MKKQLSVTAQKWGLPIVLMALFVAALFVRWIAILQTPVIANDPTLYIKVAKLYSQGAYHEAFARCPFSLFPLLIFLFYKICGDWVLAGQWASTLCGALTVIPLYLLARRIFDEKIALWGTIFYIVCPTLVMFSAEILRDMPFIFFYISALWLGYTAIKDEKMGHSALAGILIFLSVLIRREGILLLIIFSLFLIWRAIKERVSWRKATLLFAFLLIAFFGVFFLVGAFGPDIVKVTPASSERVDEARVSFSDSTIKDLEKEIEEKDLSQYGKNFFQLAKNYRFLMYFIHVIYKSIKAFSVPLFLLFLFGFIRREKVGYRADEFLLMAVYGIFIAVFLVHLNKTNYFTDRYSFPLMVPSLIWSGVGFVEFKERMIRWMKPRDFPLKDHIVRWVTPILLLLICIPLLAMAWAPHRKDKLELKEIGLWLKNNGYAHSIIVGRVEFIRLAFYAEGEFIELPKGSYQDITRFARQQKADLLVISEKTIDHLSPGFLEKISPRDLQRIDIPGIKTPKYGTTVFLIKGEGERK